MEQLLKRLERHPVIAAVRTPEDARLAAESATEAVFLLGGSLLTLPDMARTVHDAGKTVFLHIDLAGGLGKDEAAVEWCEKMLKIDGLISTRPQLLRRAADAGMITIQRLFLMDSSSLEHGIRLLRPTPPHMVEVLPGIAPKAVARLSSALDKPVIAGGLVTERSEVAEALRAGAIAVSAGDRALWNLETGINGK